MDEDQWNGAQRRLGLAQYELDWAKLWNASGGDDAPEWLLEPVLAYGRGHALYAPAKAGKSYLALHLAAAVATGRACLDRPASPAVPVLYVDYEMTPDDVLERLEVMGYGDPAELGHLHYVLLPDVDGLDRHEGGNVLIEHALDLGAHLVIIDTTGRAVVGPENEADTYLAFYRHTAMRLKLEGISWLRLDHAGKDLAKGMRGTSAKNDDVDVVWQMTRIDGGVTLRATHRRMSWVPERVNLRFDEGASPVFAVVSDGWPANTTRLAAVLDELGAPFDIGRPRARRLLASVGETARNEDLAAALKWRRDPARLLTAGAKPVPHDQIPTQPLENDDDLF